MAHLVSQSTGVIPEETIQFEVNMTKESRKFLHSHCGHGDGY